MLAIIGYRGLPSKEKLDTRLSIVKYVSVLEWSFSLEWIFKWNAYNINYEILMTFQSSTQAVNFKLLIVFLSFFFNLSFPNNIFAETFLLEEESSLSLDIWINERESGLGGGDIFQNFLTRNRIPPPIVHTRENPAWKVFKEVTYAEQENGLKILR